MTVDDTNSYLVTGDADGVIKVWDITEYCVGSIADDDCPPRKYSSCRNLVLIPIINHIAEANFVKCC